MEDQTMIIDFCSGCGNILVRDDNFCKNCSSIVANPLKATLLGDDGGKLLELKFGKDWQNLVTAPLPKVKKH